MMEEQMGTSAHVDSAEGEGDDEVDSIEDQREGGNGCIVGEAADERRFQTLSSSVPQLVGS
jgi:hypothetical protein